jgi:hypothetical protein
LKSTPRAPDAESRRRAIAVPIWAAERLESLCTDELPLAGLLELPLDELPAPMPDDDPLTLDAPLILAFCSK